MMGHAAIVELLWHDAVHDMRTIQTFGQFAVQFGHMTIVEMGLRRNLDPSMRDPSGMSLLHVCVVFNQAPAAEALIRAVADVEARNAHGYTALHHVVELNRNRLLRMLIAARCDLEAWNPNGKSPLHAAALEGNDAGVRLLVDGGAEIDALDRVGLSAVHVAVWQGHVVVLEILFRCRANMEMMWRGAPPMQLAQHYEQFEVVRWLERRMDAQRPRADGLTVADDEDISVDEDDEMDFAMAVAAGMANAKTQRSESTPHTWKSSWHCHNLPCQGSGGAPIYCMLKKAKPTTRNNK